MIYKRWFVLAVALIVSALAVSASDVSAETMLGMQPLQYREELKKGESKKAYIDITNPSGQPVTTSFNVQGFRQVGDKGDLVFYENEQLRQGIKLDYDEVEIPAYKTLRLFFVVDGAKLPKGDVFAVIFASTKPEQGTVAPSVRLGTLLILTNETPGARQANIESLRMPLLQIGEGLEGQVRIKNTAPADSSSGFFPEVRLSLWPFGTEYTVKSPLVYAGNARTVAVDKPMDLLGVYRVIASYGESRKESWVIVVTGVWRWLSVVLCATLAVLVMGAFWLRRRHQLRRRV